MSEEPDSPTCPELLHCSSPEVLVQWEAWWHIHVIALLCLLAIMWWLTRLRSTNSFLRMSSSCDDWPDWEAPTISSGSHRHEQQARHGGLESPLDHPHELTIPFKSIETGLTDWLSLWISCSYILWTELNYLLIGLFPPQPTHQHTQFHFCAS